MIVLTYPYFTGVSATQELRFVHAANVIADVY